MTNQVSKFYRILIPVAYQHPLELCLWTSEDVAKWANATFTEKHEVQEAIGHIDGRRLLNVTKEQLVQKGLDKAQCKAFFGALEDFQRGSFVTY